MSLFYLVKLKGDNKADYIAGPFKSYTEAWGSVEYQISDNDPSFTILENELELDY